MIPKSVGECEDSIIKEKLYCNIILINYYYHCYAVKKELKTRFLWVLFLKIPWNKFDEYNSQINIVHLEYAKWHFLLYERAINWYPWLKSQIDSASKMCPQAAQYHKCSDLAPCAILLLHSCFKSFISYEDNLAIFFLRVCDFINHLYNWIKKRGENKKCYITFNFPVINLSCDEYIFIILLPL